MFSLVINLSTYIRIFIILYFAYRKTICERQFLFLPSKQWWILKWGTTFIAFTNLFHFVVNIITISGRKMFQKRLIVSRTMRLIVGRVFLWKCLLSCQEIDVWHSNWKQREYFKEYLFSYFNKFLCIMSSA